MTIAGKKYDSIIITTKDDEVIALVSDDEIVESNNVKIILDEVEA